ncbi:MAG: hypothetical protein NTX44_11050 [Ignavibacteriales bacterium]|nr:hypothetical protein [Ignavibacteriales bacterium]
MVSREIRTQWNASKDEQTSRRSFFELFRKCPIPENELLMNLSLFIKRQDLSMLLFMNELYQKILSVHGVVMEFGVRWGKNLALFENFRGLYEPFNHNRRIIGFDTFSGFPSIDSKDGNDDIIKAGSFNVTEYYDEYLDQVLSYHEQESPIAHMKKYELIKGDASEQILKYLDRYPETIVALAYFDFDIYEPTLACLKAIRNRITRGSVIGFDELNVSRYPGETIALSEVFGLDRYKIHHSIYSPTQSYIVIE